MKLPVHDPDKPPTRSAEDTLAMAVVVQANLVQFKVEALRRARLDPGLAESIAVAAPGAVRRFRDALLAPADLRAMTDDQLPVALHETWGRFCMMCWLFELTGQAGLPNFGRHETYEYRCETPMQAKHAEVHAILWRLLFEHRLRHDAPLRNEPGFAELRELADRIPARAIGHDVAECSDAELAAAICEHTGMIATLRWAMDATRQWHDPTLSEVADRPF